MAFFCAVSQSEQNDCPSTMCMWMMCNSEGCGMGHIYHAVGYHQHVWPKRCVLLWDLFSSSRLSHDLAKIVITLAFIWSRAKTSWLRYWYLRHFNIWARRFQAILWAVYFGVWPVFDGFIWLWCRCRTDYCSQSLRYLSYNSFLLFRMLWASLFLPHVVVIVLCRHDLWFNSLLKAWGLPIKSDLL